MQLLTRWKWRAASKVLATRWVMNRQGQHGSQTLRFPGIPAETLLVRLDLAGVAAAAGAACHSGAIQESHVLVAMGVDGATAAESIRFSFGRDDDAETGAEAARVVSAVVEDLS